MDNNNKKGEGTIRARNKTVMLSPELAGQVRAKMASELAKNKPAVSVENQGGLHRPTVKTPPTEPASSARSGMVPPRPEAPTAVRRPTSSISSSPVMQQPSKVETPKPYQNEVVYRDEPVRAATNEPIVPSYEPPESDPYEGSKEEMPTVTMRDTVNGIRAMYAKRSKVIGFLVSFDKEEEGEFVVLRVGRLMVTSDVGSAGQDAGSGQWNMLVIPDETVSGMHAIMKIQAGELHILDQLSEHGTRIIKAGSTVAEELTQARGIASHGDKIQFGQRTFVVCMVP